MNRRIVVGAKIVFASVITIFTIYWIETVSGWQHIIEGLAGVDLGSLLIIVSGLITSHALRALRLVLCYRNLDNRWREISGIALLHNSLNFWLPMRLGELVLPILSRMRLNVGYIDSTLTLVYIRLMDIHVLLLLVFYFVGRSMLDDLYFWVSLICLAGFPVSVYFMRYLTQRLHLVQRIVSISGSGRRFLLTYFITLLVWLSKLGALTFLVIELSDVAVDHAWIGAILADATSITPITGLANAGTFEAGFVLPLTLFGYDQADTLPVAVAIHMVLGMVSLAVGLIGWSLLVYRRGIVGVVHSKSA